VKPRRSSRSQSLFALSLAILFSASLTDLATAHGEAPGTIGLTEPIEEAVAASLEPLADAMAMSLQPTADALPSAPRSASVAFMPAAPARVVTRGRTSIGAVALTFDDGINVSACRRIARTLRQRNAKATFFINGNHLKDQPAVWRKILRGMSVANHTRSHHDLTTVSDRVVSKQIRENEALHEKILGKSMLKMLRPPYGAYDSRTLRIAGQLGYGRVVLWSVDTYDWRSSTSASDIVRRATGASPGSVILMHCNRSATADALPAIIRHYKRRGIQVAGLRKVLRR
jgi:peptidoglycan/xylan/chitin deacetylase (PgdA/CDA1 family)